MSLILGFQSCGNSCCISQPSGQCNKPQPQRPQFNPKEGTPTNFCDIVKLMLTTNNGRGEIPNQALCSSKPGGRQWEGVSDQTVCIIQVTVNHTFLALRTQCLLHQLKFHSTRGAWGTVGLLATSFIVLSTQQIKKMRCKLSPLLGVKPKICNLEDGNQR